MAVNGNNTLVEPKTDVMENRGAEQAKCRRAIVKNSQGK